MTDSIEKSSQIKDIDNYQNTEDSLSLENILKQASKRKLTEEEASFVEKMLLSSIENADIARHQALSNTDIPLKAQRSIRASVASILKDTYPLNMILDCLGMSRGSYVYQIQSAQNKSYDVKYKDAIASIKEIYKESQGTYGYRRITAKMKERGFTLNHKTVQSLMSHIGTKGQSYRTRKFEDIID